ncbi:MAG: hypothetical protein A3K40_01310 [Syntrophobacterales bacterium RIFOXYC2_FULL_60_23]|nr:MAG: hypothetical protein A3K40_01310 [Syntrophobacterales bacterium RIFOXYC2_FULL_60_23]
MSCHSPLGISFLYCVKNSLVDFQAVFGQIAGKRVNFSQADFLSRSERLGRTKAENDQEPDNEAGLDG